MGIGIFWVLFAAVLLGFYALPSKYTKNYEIENVWGTFWFLAMFVVPIASTALLVNGAADTFKQVPVDILLLVIGLGGVWGVGNLLWGISIAKIGMALGFSLLIGVATLSGTLLPFFMGGGVEKLSTPGGMVILAGVFVIMLGIMANGKAGLLREKAENEGKQDASSSANMRIGIILCVIGGISAAGFNLAYFIADSMGNIGAISQEQFGNPPWVARLAVMLPAFVGSGITTVGYFATDLSKKKSWGNFTQKESGRNIFLLLIMSIVYCGSLIIYGLGAYELGELGTSVGFAIFQTGCIIVANLLGVFTGEWKQAGKTSQAWLVGGLAVMVIGIIIVAYGNSIS
ncbi:L-rhamnose/proton symporter RhaT [Flammeovirgaceae bacterium SG7u.111]|nr:L-rhamnose/proton symporter RhaT [Flammeovirgaceae bacterium SG7u.132]WPO37869.1 L-rhamnose/proton symporter RhaT [Flammeovirgaceae bacterium SG7u.111]